MYEYIQSSMYTYGAPSILRPSGTLSIVRNRSNRPGSLLPPYSSEMHSAPICRPVGMEAEEAREWTLRRRIRSKHPGRSWRSWRGLRQYSVAAKLEERDRGGVLCSGGKVRLERSYQGWLAGGWLIAHTSHVPPITSHTRSTAHLHQLPHSAPLRSTPSSTLPPRSTPLPASPCRTKMSKSKNGLTPTRHFVIDVSALRRVAAAHPSCPGQVCVSVPSPSIRGVAPGRGLSVVFTSALRT